MTLLEILETFNEGDEILLAEGNPYISKDRPYQTIIQIFTDGDMPECIIIRGSGERDKQRY